MIGKRFAEKRMRDADLRKDVRFMLEWYLRLLSEGKHNANNNVEEEQEEEEEQGEDIKGR